MSLMRRERPMSSLPYVDAPHRSSQIRGRGLLPSPHASHRHRSDVVVAVFDSAGPSWIIQWLERASILASGIEARAGSHVSTLRYLGSIASSSLPESSPRPTATSLSTDRSDRAQPCCGTYVFGIDVCKTNWPPKNSAHERASVKKGDWSVQWGVVASSVEPGGVQTSCHDVKR